MILPSRTTLILAGALAASFMANIFLLWQWAQAEPECEAKQAGASVSALQGAREADASRDLTSGSIARQSDAQTQSAVATVEKATHDDKTGIHNAYFNHEPAPPAATPSGPCLRAGPVPDRVQDIIDGAVHRANTASGVVQEASRPHDSAGTR